MKKILLISFCLCSFLLGASQNILTANFKIADIKGSLALKYDTLSRQKGKLGLYYQKGEDIISKIDSGFTDEFSYREFRTSLDTIFSQLMKKMGKPDSAKIASDAPPVINQLSEDWFKEIKKKLKPSSENLMAFKPEIKLELSDSLTADIIPNCNLKIYKEETNRSKREKGGFSSVGEVKLTRIAIQISDGFIYSFNFDIDSNTLAGAKSTIQKHQAFSIRYNLRHILLAKGMLNNTPPIILKREGTYYRTKKSETSSGFMFYIKDLFDYLAPMAGNSSIFTSKDTILTFMHCVSEKKDTMRIPEKSLYAILNLDVFGDLVGFFDQSNPNGLIQSELKAQFYGFRRPVSQVNPFRSRFTLFNKAEVYFRFSKIDNKNRFLDVLKDTVRRLPSSPDTVVRYVHGFRLLEYQNITAGLRFNLFELENRGGSVSFPVELSYLRTPLRDTLLVQRLKENNRIDTILSPVSFGKNSMLIVPGLNLKVYAASFMDIDLRARVFFILPLTRKINMSSSEYDDFYGTNNLTVIKTTKLINLGAHVTVNLNTDKTRRLIIRGENYIDLNQRGNNFWQAQVGYSADLNNFINLGKGKK